MTENFPTAPNITLKAAVTNREIDFRAPGKPSMLICLTEETQKQAEAVEEAVRARWPSASDLLIVYVIDLRKVPGIFKSMAEMMMEKEYKKALEILPEGCDPNDYIIITPDWDGDTAKALDLDSMPDALSLVILTADGRLAGALNGATPEHVLEVIEAAIAG